MNDPADALARGVAAEFRRRLLGEYVPRIARCVEMLSDEQCWQRPSPHGNSLANLLLHLAGNARQWILCGLGGEPDHRHRTSEFAATQDSEPEPARVLLERLAEIARAACAVVDACDAKKLLQLRTFQGRYDETGLAAVLHVLEHFSGHAGQIYAWTKQLTGKDLRFYEL